MRRRLLWLTGPAAAVVCAALAAPSGAAGDSTPAYGSFGFTTLGLGTGPQYGEPSLAMARDGHHYAVSTPGSDGNGHGTVQVWYSSDRGASFTHTSFTSDQGGGDSELDFRPDGTLLGADLEFGNGAQADSEIHASKDFGKTWTQPGVQAGQEQDRQWFAHTPDGKREFLVYHDFAAEAEFYVESDDGGKTWGNPHLINDINQIATPPSVAFAPTSGSTASIADQGVNTFSGPMLVANNAKDFYVVYSISNFESNANPTVGVPPFGPIRGLVMAHSADAGATWTNRYAVVAKGDPSDPSHEEQTGTMFPWAFLDPAGNVYVVYGSTRDALGTDHYGYYYVYSTDKGAHWSTPTRIDGMRPGHGSIVFNTGAGLAPGVVDVAWLQKDTSGLGETTGTWSPWFAQITAADTAHPHIARQKVTTLPNHRAGVCIQGILCQVAISPGSHDRSLLDFMELAINPVTHMAGLVYADNGGFRAGEGSGEVVFAQQTRQPALASTARATGSGTRSGSASSTGSGGRRSGSGAAGSLARTGGRVGFPVAGVALLGAALVLSRRRRRA